MFLPSLPPMLPVITCDIICPMPVFRLRSIQRLDISYWVSNISSRLDRSLISYKHFVPSRQLGPGWNFVSASLKKIRYNSAMCPPNEPLPL